MRHAPAIFAASCSPRAPGQVAQDTHLCDTSPAQLPFCGKYDRRARNARAATASPKVERMAEMLHMGPVRLLTAAKEPHNDPRAQFLAAMQLLGTPAVWVMASVNMQHRSSETWLEQVWCYFLASLHVTSLSPESARSLLVERSAVAGFLPAAAFLAAVAARGSGGGSAGGEEEVWSAERARGLLGGPHLLPPEHRYKFNIERGSGQQQPPYTFTNAPCYERAPIEAARDQQLMMTEVSKVRDRSNRMLAEKLLIAFTVLAAARTKARKLGPLDAGSG